jgi:hypothetical protein
MGILEATEKARKKRDTYDMDVHVLKEEDGKFFTVLKINLTVFLNSSFQLDKKIYYTAWYMKK